MALENFERQEEMRRERLNLQQEVKSLQTELQSKDLEISNAKTSSNNKVCEEYATYCGSWFESNSYDSQGTRLKQYYFNPFVPVATKTS